MIYRGILGCRSLAIISVTILPETRRFSGQIAKHLTVNLVYVGKVARQSSSLCDTTLRWTRHDSHVPGPLVKFRKFRAVRNQQYVTPVAGITIIEAVNRERRLVPRCIVLQASRSKVDCAGSFSRTLSIFPLRGALYQLFSLQFQ